MAKIEFAGIEEYAKKLAALGQDAEGVCKYAIYDAAGIVADAVKSACPVRTGDLRDSVGIKRMQNKNGFIYAQIEFAGYDRKGAANAIKASVLEYGTSTRQKHPFIRQAVNRVKSAAQFSIEKALDEKINEIMNEKG